MKSIQEIFKIGKGPSSSHTIGPERAATLFKSEHPDADGYRVILYESLSKTGKATARTACCGKFFRQNPRRSFLRRNHPLTCRIRIPWTLKPSVTGR